MDEQEQFTRLWTATQPVVASYLFAVVPDYQEAEDLLQEVAVSLFRKIEEYNPAYPFSAWALGMAKFAVLNFQRKRSRRMLPVSPEFLDQFAALSVEVAPELKAREEALRHCLKKLEPSALDLIALRYDDGLAPRHIAAQLGSDSTGIRARLSRIRARLRSCIEWQLRHTCS
jgi:RNA polymerase sigma-70 factor, ECF subfamily